MAPICSDLVMAEKLPPSPSMQDPLVIAPVCSDVLKMEKLPLSPLAQGPSDLPAGQADRLLECTPGLDLVAALLSGASAEEGCSLASGGTIDEFYNIISVDASCQTDTTGDFITLEHVNGIVADKVAEIDALRLELDAFHKSLICAPSSTGPRTAAPPPTSRTRTQKLLSRRKGKS